MTRYQRENFENNKQAGLSNVKKGTELWLHSEVPKFYFDLSVKNLLPVIVPSSSVSSFSVNVNFSQWWYHHTPPPFPSLTHVAVMGCLPTHYLWFLDTDNVHWRRCVYLPITCSVPNRELARLSWCYWKGSCGVLVGLANSRSFSRL